jgi:hypothetical protein
MSLQGTRSQPPRPIKTDNSTASGNANNTLKQRKSRAMDMRFYWIHDRVKQNQSIIYWQPGTATLGDYFNWALSEKRRAEDPLSHLGFQTKASHQHTSSVQAQGQDQRSWGATNLWSQL